MFYKPMTSEPTEHKRELILKAAKGVFGRYGFSKATLEDIAGDLGMKKNSLYYYFTSKEAIFKEVMELHWKRIFDKINEAITKEKSSAEKLRICFEVAQRVVKEDSSESFTIQALVDNHKTLKSFFTNYNKNSISLLTSIINEGVKSGELRKCNPQEVAITLINLVESIRLREFYITKAKLINETDFFGAEKTISILVDLIINGLKAK